MSDDTPERDRLAEKDEDQELENWRWREFAIMEEIRKAADWKYGVEEYKEAQRVIAQAERRVDERIGKV